MGKPTSPSQAALRGELQLRIQAALNDMEPIDREVLALRHFEELSNSETALILDISQAAASNRFVRAIRRIKSLLENNGPLDNDWVRCETARDRP